MINFRLIYYKYQLLIIALFYMVFLKSITLAYAEFNESDIVQGYEQDTSIHYSEEGTIVYVMPNGTKFYVEKQTDFDKVFNDINAPGYWKENELHLKEIVVVMTDYQRILPTKEEIAAQLAELPDGNATAENADYNTRISENNPPIISESIAEDDLSKFFNTSDISKQAELLSNHIFINIVNIVDNDQNNIDLRKIVANFLANDANKDFWLDHTKTNLHAQNVCRLMVASQHQVILMENNAIPQIQKNILAHINVQLTLNNLAFIYDKSVNELIENNSMYYHLYFRQFKP